MRSILVLSIVITLTITLYGNNLHVPGQYPNISSAVSASQDGDIVIVADGIYTGSNNRAIDPNGKSITIKSENGPANCIIDCQLSDPGFKLNSDEDNSTIIWGFTIRNGKYYDGGGIYLYESSPIIRECIIQDCIATGD